MAPANLFWRLCGLLSCINKICLEQQKIDHHVFVIPCAKQQTASLKMKTRHCFDIVGTVRSENVSSQIEIKVRSDTSINRVVQILCERFNLDISEVKSVVIITRTKTYSEHHRVPFDVNQVITFRDMAVVGKKSIEVHVDLLLRW
jgi:hypothetical protein